MSETQGEVERLRTEVAEWYDGSRASANAFYRDLLAFEEAVRADERHRVLAAGNAGRPT